MKKDDGFKIPVCEMCNSELPVSWSLIFDNVGTICSTCMYPYERLYDSYKDGYAGMSIIEFIKLCRKENDKN